MERTRLQVGWLIDGRGGPPQRDMALTLCGGKIESIAAARTVDRGDGLADRSELTLTPAFVDAHAHLFMSPQADPAARQANIFEMGYDDLAPSMDRRCQDFLAAGVLAVRDGGDHGGFSLRFRDEREAAQLVVRSPGQAFHACGRYGKLIGREVAPGALPQAVGDAAHEPLDHVKIVQSGINSLVRFGRVTRPQFSLPQLRAACRVAAEQGRKVMVHANGPDAVRIAAEAGCASIEHGFFMGPEAMDQLAEAGCSWVPTAVTMQSLAQNLPGNDPRALVARKNLDHQLGQIAQARSRGIKVLCGTDAGTLGVRHGPSLADEIALLMDAGFRLEEALATASSHGAELLDLDFGAIEPGREATFLGFHAPPKDLSPQKLKNPDVIWLRAAPRSALTAQGPKG